MKRAQHPIEREESLQPLLTVDEVCTVLNISRPTLHALIREGLPVIRFGKAVRIAPASLRHWLAQRERVS